MGNPKITLIHNLRDLTYKYTFVKLSYFHIKFVIINIFLQAGTIVVILFTSSARAPLLEGKWGGRPPLGFRFISRNAA